MPRRFAILLVGVAALLLLAVSCGGNDDSVEAAAPGAAENVVTVDVVGQNFSGISGTATLTPTETGTLVVVTASGEPRAGEILYAEIRTGVCQYTTVENFAYEIGPLDESTRAREREVQVSLAELQNGDQHISLGGTSRSDPSTYRVNACGFIPTPEQHQPAP